MTGVEILSKLISDNDAVFVRTLAESETQAVLLIVPSTVKTQGAAEYLPPAEQNTDQNAPVVVIVTRPTPDSAANVSSLLSRYRGDDPKAPPTKQEPGTPRKNWFW